MSLNSLQNMSSVEAKTDIYTDLNSLNNLKSSARKDAKSALPEVARQFEAVMISMMIKNLRKTGMEDPIFKSQAMDSYRDMYDQQLGMELSKGQGIGFAKAIVQQMQYQSGDITPPPSSEGGMRGLNLPQRHHFSDMYSSVEKTETTQVKQSDLKLNQIDQKSPNIDTDFDSPEHFVKKLWPLAEQTAQKLNVSPEIILSQSALETGWGQHVISNDHNSSFNLFNIKADQSWAGKSVEKVSMEYSHGKPIQKKSAFRAYDSFEQSFNDYVNFIQNNPRYKNALNKTDETSEKMEQSLHDKSYINGIHKAGYATDPAYADKIMDVLKSEAIQNQRVSQIKLASK